MADIADIESKVISKTKSKREQLVELARQDYLPDGDVGAFLQQVVDRGFASYFNNFVGVIRQFLAEYPIYHGVLWYAAQTMLIQLENGRPVHIDESLGNPRRYCHGLRVPADCGDDILRMVTTETPLLIEPLVCATQKLQLKADITLAFFEVLPVEVRQKQLEFDLAAIQSCTESVDVIVWFDWLIAFFPNWTAPADLIIAAAYANYFDVFDLLVRTAGNDPAKRLAQIPELVCRVVDYLCAEPEPGWDWRVYPDHRYRALNELVARGCDISLACEGVTPVSIAIANDQLLLVAHLKKLGAKLTVEEEARLAKREAVHHPQAACCVVL